MTVKREYEKKDGLFFENYYDVAKGTNEKNEVVETKRLLSSTGYMYILSPGRLAEVYGR